MIVLAFPQLYEPSIDKQYLQEFRGYNHNLSISEGEFYDQTNMTSDFYPLLSPRKKRGEIKTISNPNGMIGKDALAYVDGTKIVYNDYEIDLQLSTAAEDCPKQLVSMGAYLIVFPDKKYLNTVDLTDYGSLEASITTGEGSTVTFSMCESDGSDYENVIIQADEPKNPVNGQYWIDTSQSAHQLKVYSENTNYWVSVATTYVKISCAGIGVPFNQWDGVTISGCTAYGTADLNNTMVIYDKGDDYIVVVGILDQVETQTDPVTIKRTVPKLDYVTESGNRLWGCHYGVVDGKTVNEIYASKLGDPKNWNVFLGLSTDSYTVSLGSDGAFTGAITYLGYPMFFKENCIHKIYGNYPSNYQAQTTACRGVQNGCSQSLVIVDETLYYKSPFDICAYSGSLPNSISEKLGMTQYKNVVAGGYGGKYYVSMQDASGEWGMYVYDTRNGFWNKEDNVHALCFAPCDNDLYFIGEDKKLYSVTGAKGTLENQLEWSVESGEIGYRYPDNKYISRLQIRMSLGTGSQVKVYVQYDHSGEWLLKGTLSGVLVRTYVLPIVPIRCDHMKIKITGVGECKIYSIAKLLETGGDT